VRVPLAVFVAVSIPAVAQSVYSDRDPGVVAPRVLERVTPEYTEQARIARLEGTVEVTLLVDDNAAVRNVHVTRPLGLGLDEKAVEAVKRWTFAPGTRDGKPVPVLTRAEVNFRLLTARRDWYLNRADFETPRDAIDPVVKAAQFPPAVEGGGYTTVVISFEIDTEGRVRDARAQTASGAEQEAMKALNEWVFEPATRDGKALAVQATFGFAAGRPEPKPSGP
jgi:TonB family protein